MVSEVLTSKDMPLQMFQVEVSLVAVRAGKFPVSSLVHSIALRSCGIVHAAIEWRGSVRSTRQYASPPLGAYNWSKPWFYQLTIVGQRRQDLLRWHLWLLLLLLLWGALLLVTLLGMSLLVALLLWLLLLLLMCRRLLVRSEGCRALWSRLIEISRWEL